MLKDSCPGGDRLGMGIGASNWMGAATLWMAALAATPLDRVSAEYGGIECAHAGSIQETFALHDGAQPVGVMSLRRTPVVGGALHEQELCFMDGVRVYVTERRRGDSRRLVWREVGPGLETGRIWVLEGRQGDPSLKALTWAGGPAIRTDLQGTAGALMPLEFLELLRRNEHPNAPFQGVVPLRGRVEAHQVECELVHSSRADPGEGTVKRVYRMQSENGTPLGSWTLQGSSVLAREWPNGRRAERVDPATYAALLTEWGVR